MAKAKTKSKPRAKTDFEALTQQEYDRLPIYRKEKLVCPRCAARHKIVFHKFCIQPAVFDYDDSTDEGTFEYWGMCPRVNEPVLMDRRGQIEGF